MSQSFNTTPQDMLSQLLDALSKELQNHRHVERYLRWAVSILSRHGAYMQRKATGMVSVFRYTPFGAPYEHVFCYK